MKNAYNTMKTLKSLLIISLVFVLCGSCKTHRDKAKKENEIFQQGQYTNKFQQVSQVAADIIHKLKLSTRRALVISQPNTSSNSVTSGTEQIIIPAPQLMSDGYTYIIRINHTTRQYWWTKQGGISGIIERYGPIQYQDKESDKASETINTNSVSVVMHPNYPNKGMPIALASINQHKPCSDILLFTGFALTNEFSKSISTILNKFNINAQCFDVPVIYETYWGINFLSKSFQAEIKSSADTISGSGTKFWFVLVLSFQYYVDFTVYLKPDIVTPRLRKGNKLDVFEISERKRWEHLDLPFLSPYYYQVSLLDKPFSDEILPPDYYTMPFSVDDMSYTMHAFKDGLNTTNTYTPDPITDEEIIDIIDGARKYLCLTDGPIYKISKMKDVVTVKTAISRFATCGRGAVLMIQKIDGKWKLVSKNRWLS